MSKTTISESRFLEEFNTEEKAVQFFEEVRWAKGRFCPKCGSVETYPLKSRKFYYNCKGCRKHFSCKHNTVMESSRIPVRTWLYAMYKVSVARKDISSLQLAKQLGITQKSAWFMLQRIKEACGNDPDILSGIVETDETYIGGLEKSKHEKKKVHAGRRTVGKACVLGTGERGGKTKVIKNRKSETLEGETSESVKRGSVVFTDGHKGYSGLLEREFEHDTVNHSAKEYVKGMASTNGIESVWAVLKRSITGTYHHVSLPRHVNETTAFRFNEGDLRNALAHRIASLCDKMVGHTIPYKELTA